MNPPKTLILDVDGVMTTGQFYYTSEGKMMKVFGPDDNDGLSLVKNIMDVHFISADKKGFPITEKRIAIDMGYKLDLVSTTNRIEWIRNNYDPQEVIYMGDGIFDHYVMQNVQYSIAPANADFLAKKTADYVTVRKGGDRAVAEACLHILEKFFTPFDPCKLPSDQTKIGTG